MDIAPESVIATVQMPERGVFQVRCREGSDVRAMACGARVVVQLDYGTDVGELKGWCRYDPAKHGPRLPGFRLERLMTPADGEVEGENAARAAEMAAEFRKLAREKVPEVRVPMARLSLGGTRLFLRYAVPSGRADFGEVVARLRERYRVSMQVWQVGPRDEVVALGALGPCGRVCCCRTWQTRFPGHVAVPAGLNAASANGMCGRYKCCLSFEENDARDCGARKGNG